MADNIWSVVRVGRLGVSLSDRSMEPVQSGLTFEEADRYARVLTRAVQMEGDHWPWVAYVLRGPGQSYPVDPAASACESEDS